MPRTAPVATAHVERTCHEHSGEPAELAVIFAAWPLHTSPV